MLYDLEQGELERNIIERSRKYKLPLPDSIKNAPILFDGLELYYNAFWRLSTCRSVGMSVGNITYFDCVKYCTINDIIGEQSENLIEIVLKMDKIFIEHLKTTKSKDTKC